MTISTGSSAKIGAGARGFTAFAARVGLDLERFQRSIVTAAFAAEHELLVLLPRGNGKSRLVGTLAVHHLLTTPRAAIYIAASSREQATVIFDYARDVAEHPSLEGMLTVRHLELRAHDGGRLHVLASDAPKLHGLTPSLAVVDELHAHRDTGVYVALRTALVKRPGSRMVTLSTAGQSADSPLGLLRARALAAPHVTRRGPLTHAHGAGLRMLEWALPETASIDDMRRLAAANPASWMTAGSLRDCRAAVHEGDFRRYHANQWVAGQSSVFPPGAWQACAGDATIAPGASIVIGLDAAGKGGADTALAWVDDELRVGCEVFPGQFGLTQAAEAVDELARTYRIREIACDPWAVLGPMTEAWERRGLTVVPVPQFDSRMVPASQGLYRAVVEQRLTHPDHPALNEHVAGSTSEQVRRGWRIGKAPGRNNDALIALALAVSRAQHKPEPVRLLGWL